MADLYEDDSDLFVAGLAAGNQRVAVGIREGREVGYQIPVPRLIFAKIPVTKSKIPLLVIICKIMRIIN